MAVPASNQLQAALREVEQAEASDAEKAEMLMEIAMGLQVRPRTPDDLKAAVALYRRALELVPADDNPLLNARITARLATALQALPGEDAAPLQEARTLLQQQALPVLRTHGTPEETAEAEMNLGVILQALAGAGLAPMRDAIAAYQRALRVFDGEKFPREHAILQNNLATAFLAMPMNDDSGKMREALAVQAFEAGLKAVNIIDHPVEYAMLQNNLGNALQQVRSSHPLENRQRALQAYDEALKVRTRHDAPLPHANTIANKAMCLLGLPDDMEHPQRGNPSNTATARALLREAAEIFRQHGEPGKAAAVEQVLQELEVAMSGQQRSEAVVKR